MDRSTDELKKQAMDLSMRLLCLHPATRAQWLGHIKQADAPVHAIVCQQLELVKRAAEFKPKAAPTPPGLASKPADKPADPKLKASDEPVEPKPCTDKKATDLLSLKLMLRGMSKSAAPMGPMRAGMAKALGVLRSDMYKHAALKKKALWPALAAGVAAGVLGAPLIGSAISNISTPWWQKYQMTQSPEQREFQRQVSRYAVDQGRLRGNLQAVAAASRGGFGGTPMY